MAKRGHIGMKRKVAAAFARWQHAQSHVFATQASNAVPFNACYAACPDSIRAAYSEPLGAYLATFTPMHRAKVANALTRFHRFSGAIMARHIHAEQLAASGASVDTARGRIYTGESGGIFYATKDLTKTFVDYLAWLIERREREAGAWPENNGESVC